MAISSFSSCKCAEIEVNSASCSRNRRERPSWEYSDSALTYVMRFTVICNWSLGLHCTFHWIGLRVLRVERPCCLARLTGGRAVSAEASECKACPLLMIHTRTPLLYNVGSKVPSGLIALIHNGCLSLSAEPYLIKHTSPCSQRLPRSHVAAVTLD